MIKHPPCRIVDAAIGFALAAADAGIDLFRELFDLGPLQNVRFKFEQIERRSENMTKHLNILKLAGIHEALGIDSLPVTGKFFHNRCIEILQFGNADAVFPGNHTAKRNDLLHHLIDDLVGAFEHGTVVRKHGNVHMNVAVASMHVGSDSYAAVADILVGLLDGPDDFRVTLQQFGKFPGKLVQQLQ